MYCRQGRGCGVVLVCGGFCTEEHDADASCFGCRGYRDSRRIYIYIRKEASRVTLEMVSVLLIGSSVLSLSCDLQDEMEILLSYAFLCADKFYSIGEQTGKDPSDEMVCANELKGICFSLYCDLNLPDTRFVFS